MKRIASSLCLTLLLISSVAVTGCESSLVGANEPQTEQISQRPDDECSGNELCNDGGQGDNHNEL